MVQIPQAEPMRGQPKSWNLVDLRGRGRCRKQTPLSNIQNIHIFSKMALRRNVDFPLPVRTLSVAIYLVTNFYRCEIF